MTFHMWRGSIITVILRGRSSIWWSCRMTFVAPRIVNDVSYVTRINHHSHFAWQEQYLPFRYVVMSNVVSCEVTCGAAMWLCATCDVTETLLQIKSNALTRKWTSCFAHCAGRFIWDRESHGSASHDKTLHDVTWHDIKKTHHISWHDGHITCTWHYMTWHIATNHI